MVLLFGAPSDRAQRTSSDRDTLRPQDVDERPAVARTPEGPRRPRGVNLGQAPTPRERRASVARDLTEELLDMVDLDASAGTDHPALILGDAFDALSSGKLIRLSQLALRRRAALTPREIASGDCPRDGRR